MLGLRPTSTGVYGLAPWFRDVPELRNRVTLPQYFKQHGYTTLCGGKVYHGGGGKTRQEEFDVWSKVGGVGAKPEHKLIGETPGGNHQLMDWGVFPHQDEDKGDYQVASWAVNQIQTLPKNQPFFLAVGFFLPHVPCYTTQKWYDLFPDDDSVLPVVSLDDRSDTPRFSWYLHWYLPEPRLAWVREHDQWRNLARSYLACSSFVDGQIGRIIDALKAEGLNENTVVVVWGDHGYHLGEKEITGKNSLWEESTRVPLIFAGPGVTAGGRVTSPAELLDIYPTLIDLCGLPPRNDLEGLSLRPQLQDEQSPRERPAITSHNQGNHAIRTTDARYIRYADGSEEFYDHLVDPNEWQNLTEDPKSAARMELLKRWLPAVDMPMVEGSAHRVLSYDRETDEAEWEGQTISRKSPIP